MTPDKVIEAQFFFNFETTDPVYFAMCYPYSFTDLQRDLDQKERVYSNHPTIYFKREHLVSSFEGKRIDLLTISSHSLDTRQLEERVHPDLFPEQDLGETPAKR